MQENHFLDCGVIAGSYSTEIDAGGKSGCIECQRIGFLHRNFILQSYNEPPKDIVDANRAYGLVRQCRR